MQADRLEAGINRLAEFSDRALEAEFFESERDSFVRRVRQFIMLGSIVYILFLISDWFLIRDRGILNFIIVNRFALAGLMMVPYSRFSKIKTREHMYACISLLELVFAASFCSIAYLYENPDYLIQAFGLICIVTLVFFAPNRWLYQNLVALISSIAFFAVFAATLEHIPPSDFWAGVVYTFLIMGFASSNAYSRARSKRAYWLQAVALERTCGTDPLTGLHNRYKFNSEFERWKHVHQSEERPGSVIILDIDDFKEINDAFGHLIGDKIIAELGALVQANIREGDMLFRWGGEEFIVLLRDCDQRQAFMAAEKLRGIVEQACFARDINITCSFGVATDMSDLSATELLARCDRHLYAAKSCGKNVVVDASREYPASHRRLR